MSFVLKSVSGWNKRNKRVYWRITLTSTGLKMETQRHINWITFTLYMYMCLSAHQAALFFRRSIKFNKIPRRVCLPPPPQFPSSTCLQGKTQHPLTLLSDCSLSFHFIFLYLKIGIVPVASCNSTLKLCSFSYSLSKMPKLRVSLGRNINYVLLML